MRQSKWILTLAFLALVSANVQANYRPLVKLSYGTDRVDLSNNTDVMFIPPFINTYTSDHHEYAPVGGITLGVAIPLINAWSAELGLSYYRNQALQASGHIYQFGDPTLNDLDYTFKIQSQRLLLEGKFLYALNTHWQPFINLGLGGISNKSYHYNEVQNSPTALSLTSPFGSQRKHSFTYTVGIGLDYTLADNWKVGASIAYADLGKAGLSTSAQQVSGDTIQYRHLHTQEFLIQLTYLA